VTERSETLGLDVRDGSTQVRTTDESGAALALTNSSVLKVVLPAILVVNVLNAYAVFLHRESDGGGRFFATFSLDGEANVPAWFSSALLLSAAALVGLVSIDAAARRARWSRHWAGLAFVYAGLSLDETAQIHERIGSYLRAHFDLHGPLHYAGVIPALLAAFLVGVTYFRFFRALPRQTRWGIAVAATLYIGGAAVVEAGTGWWTDSHSSGSTAVLLVSTVEENLEMAGTTLFMLVVISYFTRFGGSVTFLGEP
jgi:hypothetical protein